MREDLNTFFTRLLHDLSQADQELALLIVLVVIIVIVLDAVAAAAKVKRQATGIKLHTHPGTLPTDRTMAVRDYSSSMQRLAGKPDALLNEGGFIIPVERKPLARKIHDRFIAQLLVYMRLVEEFEGKRPPFGYLILGKNCRRVKIYNTEERQAWLQQYLDEMHAILEHNKPVQPTPHPRKCRRCAVRASCQFRVDEPQLGQKE